MLSFFLPLSSHFLSLLFLTFVLLFHYSYSRSRTYSLPFFHFIFSIISTVSVLSLIFPLSSPLLPLTSALPHFLHLSFSFLFFPFSFSFCVLALKGSAALRSDSLAAPVPFSPTILRAAADAVVDAAATTATSRCRRCRRSDEQFPLSLLLIQRVVAAIVATAVTAATDCRRCHHNDDLLPLTLLLSPLPPQPPRAVAATAAAVASTMSCRYRRNFRDELSPLSPQLLLSLLPSPPLPQAPLHAGVLNQIVVT